MTPFICLKAINQLAFFQFYLQFTLSGINFFLIVTFFLEITFHPSPFSYYMFLDISQKQEKGKIYDLTVISFQQFRLQILNNNFHLFPYLFITSADLFLIKGLSYILTLKHASTYFIYSCIYVFLISFLPFNLLIVLSPFVPKAMLLLLVCIQ